jgi:hypothetical protein
MARARARVSEVAQFGEYAAEPQKEVGGAIVRDTPSRPSAASAQRAERDEVSEQALAVWNISHDLKHAAEGPPLPRSVSNCAGL